MNIYCHFALETHPRHGNKSLGKPLGQNYETADGGLFSDVGWPSLKVTFSFVSKPPCY